MVTPMLKTQFGDKNEIFPIIFTVFDFMPILVYDLVFPALLLPQKHSGPHGSPVEYLYNKSGMNRTKNVFLKPFSKNEFIFV